MTVQKGLFSHLIVVAILQWSASTGGDLFISPDQRYLLLTTKRTSTMQEELNQAARQGFRIVVGEAIGSDEIGYFLERIAEPNQRFRYQLLATERLATMQREMNLWSSEGYRLVPSSVVVVECEELILVLEGYGDSEISYEYRILGTHRTGTLEQEVNDLASQGFDLKAMGRIGQNLAILEGRLSP